MHLVFLPATDPHDMTYGAAPDRIAAYPDLSTSSVKYPAMVWYNRAVRESAIGQIRELGVKEIILVGFSKSGLGAWNIAMAIPDLIAGTIIFDAPAAREDLPPWGTDAFYPDNAAWRRDLPLNTIHEFAAAMPASHRLILISGASFREEMRSLSQALMQQKLTHVFLDRPGIKHHWNAGWIEEGLDSML